MSERQHRKFVVLSPTLQEQGHMFVLLVENRMRSRGYLASDCKCVCVNSERLLFELEGQGPCMPVGQTGEKPPS
jgi:hypothetical protein